MSDIDAGERKPPALPPKPIRASASDEAEPRTATPEPGSQPPAVPPKPDRSRLPPELPPKPKTKEAGRRPLSEYNVKHIVKLQALIRRHLCVVKWRQYAKMIAKRTNVAKEILSTEKQYVQNLRSLVAGFLQPLRENAKSAAPLITEENLKGVFSDIEVILGYHSLLEKELEKRISAWSQSVKLGDIFLKIASFLKTYNQYIQHYKKANLLLIDLNKNPEFAAMMEKLRFSPVCGGKGIKDFLIMPVQRIPRYSMLLQDMVKNTWSHHGDYAALSQALKTILELASYVEEQQGENANVIKVLEVQNMLSGKVMDGTKLVQPSRRYVREAAATKHERDGKQFPVHLFLFNDILIWSKPKKADTHEVIKLDSLITLIVKDAEIGLLDAPTHVRAIGIVTPQGASTVILASTDEKRLWQTDLRKFIKESNDKYNAVKKREGGDLGNDDINDILNFQKVTVTAVHGTKKEEGSAIAREMGAFSGKIRNGFSSVLSRASGGSTRKDEDEARSTPAKPGSSPRGNRPGSLINVSTTKEPATPVRSPRSATITASSSVGSLQTPPRLANSGRSLSAATTTTPSKSADLPSPTTPQRSTTDNASTTAAAGPALLPTPVAPPTSAPPPESPKGERMEPSPRREKKEKKERTRRGTLDTADVSPRKERTRPSRKDASERPAGYGTLRSPQTSTPAASVAPSAATTDSIPQASPRTPLSLDVDTQTKLARLKDENEEAARRLKKMQEKFGAVVLRVAVKFVRVFAHQSVFRLVFRGVLLAMKLRGRRRRRIVLSTVFYVWSAQQEPPW